MSVRFNGIYQLDARQQSGPTIKFRHYSRKQKVVTHNTMDVLLGRNEKTAYFHASGIGTYFFRDDKYGNHYEQFNEVMAQHDQDLGKAKGFDLSNYCAWVISPVMDKIKAAGEALLTLIEQEGVGTALVKYDVEERARHYNGAQWSNGAGDPGSERVQSAIHINKVIMRP